MPRASVHPSRTARAGVSASHEETRRLVRSLWRDVSNEGRRFVLVLVPSAVEVNEAFWRNQKHSTGSDFSSPTRARVGHWSEDGRAEEGIDVVDLYPIFEEQGSKRAFLLAQDAHWNEAGNRLASDVVCEAIWQRLAR